MQTFQNGICRCTNFRIRCCNAFASSDGCAGPLKTIYGLEITDILIQTRGLQQESAVAIQFLVRFASGRLKSENQAHWPRPVCSCLCSNQSILISNLYPRMLATAFIHLPFADSWHTVHMQHTERERNESTVASRNQGRPMSQQVCVPASGKGASVASLPKGPCICLSCSTSWTWNFMSGMTRTIWASCSLACRISQGVPAV